jgi:hypothetical protein
VGGAGKDGQFRRSVSRRHDRGSERSAASNLMRLIDTAIAVDEPSRMGVRHAFRGAESPDVDDDCSYQAP